MSHPRVPDPIPPSFRMDARFAELLQKAKEEHLTSVEKNELARLLNAPLLERPLIDFVSKHSMKPSDVEVRINNIKWFDHCAEPVRLDLTMSIERVSSWAQAIGNLAWASQTEHMRSSWKNVQLAAQNQLTRWLCDNRPDDYSRWDDIAGKHEESTNALIREKILPFQKNHELPDCFIQSVNCDISFACMENSYLWTGHRCCFFLELLWVYEAGHFPCGWVGKWPDGKLLVH